MLSTYFPPLHASPRRKPDDCDARNTSAASKQQAEPPLTMTQRVSDLFSRNPRTSQRLHTLQSLIAAE